MNKSFKSPTAVWEQFQKGLRYQKSMGLDEEWKMCEDFVEGNQWPQATDRTKNLPRPVINICSMIADSKKAGILSGNIKMIFKPAEMFGDLLEKATQGAEIFTKFSDYVNEEMGQKDLDDELQSYVTQLGTGILHYYWDTTISGGMYTPYVGGLRGEVVHPKNIVVANPLEKDEQKQKYIIIASSEPLSSVKELAKRNKVQDWDNIASDHELEDNNIKELEMCTVLTKYFRQNGQVVWQKSTKYHDLQKPTLWQPQKEQIRLEDEQEINEPETVNNATVFFRKQLYPVVFCRHKERKKCIFGIGEVKQIIPNNKAINFGLAMMLLSVQQTAWPKIIQKTNALASQVITNAPGEILTDHTKGSMWGAKYMETPGFNPQALTLTNTLLDLTRTAAQASEVTTGEVMGANMAASAIIALQNQAKKPIEMFQQNFYRIYKKIGKIWLQFFKHYYNDGRLFGYENNGQTIVASMNGQEYQDIDYNTSVEVGAGGIYSESLTVNLLDTMKANQDIDLDTYIELYPDSIMTFKSKLKSIRERQQAENAMLQQQMMEQQMLEQQGQLPYDSRALM